MRSWLKSKKFQNWSEIAKRGFCENIVAFDRSMPAINRVKQFNAAQVSCRQGIRILQSHIGVVTEFAIQITYHRAQLLIHHPCKPNQIGAVCWPEGSQVFVSGLQMRIARCVVRSQALCDFTASEVRPEIDKTIHDDCDPVTLHAGATNQPTHLSREIFSETPAEFLQTILRPLKLRGKAPPGPINVVVS